MAAPAVGLQALQHAAGATSKAALDACLADLASAAPGCLALVLGCSGHTYARPGTLMHIAADGRHSGWISAGCLERDVLGAARASLDDQLARLLDLDNRDLSDVFSGSGAGCRGRQHILVVPLAALPGLQPLLAEYRRQDGALALSYADDGSLSMQAGATSLDWSLATDPTADAEPQAWALQLAPLPRVLLLGAGPESELLLHLLGQLGWRTELVESRPEWQAVGRLAEHQLDAMPDAARASCYQAVLVMAHHFGNDRAALEALAGWPRLPPYIGLLGARTRRDDLLATLPPTVRERLADCLESPAGLPLGGRGGAAIALSLAARLQGLQVED
jgi:xanthine dehydrogenase accessory factor